MNYRCPKHNKILRVVPEYSGAMVHDGCMDIFIVIDGHLCILDGLQWKDTKTGEIRLVQKTEGK